MTDSKFSFSTLSVFQKAVLIAAVKSADKSGAVQSLRVPDVGNDEVKAAFKALVEKGHLVARDGKPFLSEEIAAAREEAIAAAEPQSSAKVRKVETKIVGGAVSRVTIDPHSATRKGSLHLTEARRSMLALVKKSKTPPAVSQQTNAKANTLHGPTAERLHLLGLLYIHVTGGQRVATITKDGEAALSGATIAGPAPSKRAKKSEPTSEEKNAVQREALAEKKAGRPRSVSEKPSKKKASKKASKKTSKKSEPEAKSAPKTIELPKAKDIRGKDKRMSPATLLEYLATVGVEESSVKFSAPKGGAKKLVAKFSPFSGEVNDAASNAFLDHLRKSGCSISVEGGVVTVKNVRFNAKLAA